MKEEENVWWLRYLSFVVSNNDSIEKQRTIVTSLLTGTIVLKNNIPLLLV